MEFLKRHRWIGLVSLLALFAAACLVPGTEPRPPAFDHAMHLGLERLDCAVCHPGGNTGGEPGMPTPAVCRVCHEKIDADKPVEFRALAQFDDAANYKRSRVSVLTEEVRFSHATHVTNHGVDCAACHGDMTQTRGLSKNAATKAACMSCHAERGFQNNCESCHREIRADTVPHTHRLSWGRRHGGVVHAGPEGSVNQCSLCHNEQRSSCQTCHREAVPKDHTHYWRLRGHGIATAIDRSRCATCHHTPDFCSRCHARTRPRNHRPGFGSPRNRHCGSCHLPVEGEGCVTCHKGTPSHATAAPLPANHSPAMNCRQCHGLTARLPHPDAGAACTQCHR